MAQNIANTVDTGNDARLAHVRRLLLLLLLPRAPLLSDVLRPVRASSFPERDRDRERDFRLFDGACPEESCFPLLSASMK